MDVNSLRARISGRVIEAADSDYEAVRAALVWNALKPERRPALVVQVASEADITETIRFARSQALRVAVRSGGHSWCGTPLRDGAVVLDLSRLDAVAVDPQSRTATVQPAVRNTTLHRQLAAHGLAFPLGHCPSVAVGGYLLTGGFGWNAGQWGPACFSVRAIDVVLADGSQVHANADQNSDLLWAARGSGPGFFGVVTRYHLDVYPLPQAIETSSYVFRLDQLPELLPPVTAVGDRLERSVELVTMVVADAAAGWTCAVTATAFAATPDQARQALAPLDEAAFVRRALRSRVRQPTPFGTLYEDMDRLFPAQHRYIADTAWSNAEPNDLLDGMVPHFEAAPSSKSLLMCIAPPPPPADAPLPPDAAFSMGARSFALCYAVWDEPAADAANRAWHGAAMKLLEAKTVGHYIGESDIAATPSRAAASFAPSNWQRLAQLRRRFDPDGLFHAYFDEP